MKLILFIDETGMFQSSFVLDSSLLIWLILRILRITRAKKLFLHNVGTTFFLTGVRKMQRIRGISALVRKITFQLSCA